MRTAVADIGTNSTRLLVADVDGTRVAEVERLLEITRLGEGVDANRALGDEPMRRVLGALGHYAARAEALGAERRVAVATSAVRDAANRDAFLAAIRALGFEPRLVTGEEEAAATFAGVVSDRPGNHAGLLVLDIGGGSTELVLGGAGGSVAWSLSIDVGCVRVTERFLGEECIPRDKIARAREAIGAELEAVPNDVVASTREAVGVAGTVTTVAALDLGLDVYDAERIHGHRVGRDHVDELLVRLAPMTLEERRRAMVIEPKRAPVICAGLVVLSASLERLGLDSLEASERDILHGAALLAAR
jgi:exopolyphosphatase/guanosine-5'-triphosphate,3'-diphosphate pyrophosphatase